MAITDYSDGAPTITSTNTVAIYYGTNYDLTVNGTNLSSFCKFKSIILEVDYWGELNAGHIQTNPTDSAVNRFLTLYFKWWDSSSEPTSGEHIVVYNPVLYTLQTPPRIMISAAHHVCGIAEADIDTTSFDTVHTWANNNTMFRSVALLGDSCLKIFKELCEHSHHIYLYINGSNKLACGYISNTSDPSTPADWEIDVSDLKTVKSYGMIRDRKVPEKIRCGYSWIENPMSEPRFPRIEEEYVSLVDPENIMQEPYEARFLDPKSKGDDKGLYIKLFEYVKLVVEVGGIGFVMDIDDTVQVTSEPLGLTFDESFPDIFLIQKIVRNPMTMCAEVTMIKHYTWNDT